MKGRFILHLVALFVLSTTVLQADDLRWKQSQTGGEELMSRGRYAEASKSFEMALDAAKEFGSSDLRRLQSLSSLAMAYQQQGRPSEADHLYGKVLALSEEALGPKNPLVIKILNNRANLRGAQARFAEAEVLYLRALSPERRCTGRLTHSLPSL